MHLVPYAPSDLTPVFERARQALAEARTTDEVKVIRDQAQAIQAYLHQQRAGLEMQNDVAEIKIRAERRLGEMLGEMEKNKGGNPNLTHRGLGSQPTLSTLGIDDHQSHRWQTMAMLPEADFEEAIAERKAASQELTSAFMLRTARQGRSEEPMPPLPEGVYDVIYADPPWPYDNQIESWGPTSLHYRSVSLERIYALDISAARDSTLFLWVTNPFLRVGLELMDAWGFLYKTNIVWIKTNRKRPGSGFYVRGHHELLLIGTKGSHVPLQAGRAPVSSVLEADVQEHSRKPSSAYALIEAMYPDGKKLELFARPPFREGWTVWGDEASE